MGECICRHAQTYQQSLMMEEFDWKLKIIFFRTKTGGVDV